MKHLNVYEALQKLFNIEEYTIGLYDLKLEHQVQLLEYFKRFKDIEKGKVRGHGFGNCWKLNQKRSPKVFTHLETQFKSLAEDFDLMLEHEVRIKIKDKLNKQHIFKLDFLDPLTRINVELSPQWHKKYLVVERRDALRRRLLKRVGIRSLTVFACQKGDRSVMDYVRAKRVIKIIQNARISPNCLNFYIEGVSP
jgi:hypothetical protein